MRCKYSINCDDRTNSIGCEYFQCFCKQYKQFQFQQQNQEAERQERLRSLELLKLERLAGGME